MGKIDKEKLLKELTDWHVPEQIINIVEAVPEDPEEQEIDFDAIWEEYEEKYSCKKTTNCDNCTYPNKLYYTTICFVDFLKSKNLTQPQVDMDALRNEIYASIQKPIEIPVKKTWTLKKEYEDFCTEFLLQSVKTVMSVEPVGASKQYYDQHEEPDYSKIPVGSVVCINGIYAGVVSKTIDEFKVIHLRFSVNDNANMSIYYCDIKSLEILKWPENVK